MLRSPVVAGMFYPADPEVLRKEVKEYLDFSGDKNKEVVQAALVMLPHAGHVYCGKVIGKTLSSVRLPSRLIILCPSHTGRGDHLAVWSEGAWRTPLGEVPVDAECASAIIKASVASPAQFTADTTAHLGEHSIEVLLPFLQTCVPDLQITPICVSCHPKVLQAAGQHLANVIQHFAEQGISMGIVISSDMNHYADETTTLQLDNLALEPFLAMNPVKLFNTVSSYRISMCGIFPATLALFACQELGITPPAVLASHSTSAAASGDTRRVVGYAGCYCKAQKIV